MKRDTETSVGSPLSRLEFKLERLNRLSDIEDEFLKRLYDRRSVSEQYCAGGQLDLHVHIRVGDGMFCAKYRKRQAIEIAISKGINCRPKSSIDTNEFPVRVWITQGLESSRPIVSVVRLQPLYCCDMTFVDSLEPSLLLPPSEMLFRAFNWKLRSVLREAGIMFGEFKNEIIERAPQIITNLPNENRDANVSLNSGIDGIQRCLRIGIDGDNIIVGPRTERDVVANQQGVLLPGLLVRQRHREDE
jgi:hypothetical protein